MYALLGFKSLIRLGDKLKSSVRGTVWKRVTHPLLGETYRLKARKDDLGRGYGIFAGTYDEALSYGRDVYIVAPDPECCIVEADKGWRAEAAFVVGGPFTRGNLRQAAEMIIAAYRAGYPQIRHILLWAALVCRHNDILVENIIKDDIDFLYQACCKPIEENLKPAIIEKFIEYGNARYFEQAGEFWPDCNWDRAIADALINTADPGYLYSAGLNWPEARYTFDITAAFAALGDADFLVLAGEYWPDTRWHQIIAQALIAVGNAGHIRIAGKYWPDGRWSPFFAELLLRSGDIDALVLAGLEWSDKRWIPAITDILVSKGNAAQLYSAGFAWPDARWDSRIADALISAGDPEYLYWAGFNWPDSRYTPRIAQKLIETGNARFLSKAGADWPDERWTPDIADALIKTRDPKWLCSAHIDWADKRWSRAIAEALVASDETLVWIEAAFRSHLKRQNLLLDLLINEKAEKLYRFYINTSFLDSTASNKIIKALIEKADIDVLLNAAIELPDKKYDSLIIDAAEEYIDEAQFIWLIEALPDTRYKPSLTVSFCNKASPSWLAIAMRQLPQGRYDKIVGEKFLEKADPHLVFEAIKTLDSELFRGRMLECLAQEKNLHILEYLVTMLHNKDTDVEIAEILISLYTSKKTQVHN